ncbi:MAG: S-adenosylhomocysteine deaminase, partial [Saprospiraceae bacterium]
MKYFSADYIIPVTSEPIANGVIQLNDEGRLVRIGKQEDFPTVDIQIVKGIILPGFVNAHCHLELSHMQG